MSQPHRPQLVPLESLDWVALIPLIGEANRQFAFYAGILNGIPNPEVFLAPLILQEAVLSSRIEGTEETLEDVLRFEADVAISPEKLAGVQEIINYRAALDYATAQMQERPLNLNMIKSMHGVLMNSVRGKDKGRGEFRRTQVYLGKKGAGIENASYIPPAPEHLMEFLDNWEKYIHYDEKDRLAQLAIIHAQFEIIHPFLDGNGRIGRILIPLFLYEKGLLARPDFYISAYFEANRDEYIDRLNRITRVGDWNGWVAFFLRAIAEQSKVNANKAKQILELYEQMKERLPGITRSPYAIRGLDAIFRQPIFTAANFVAALNVPARSGYNVLNKLRDESLLIVYELGSGSRPDLLAFPKLLQIIEITF